MRKLEAIFGLSEWKQTRFYQEVREETQLETKLETIPRLLKSASTGVRLLK
jgi:predicted transposase YdaD